jgi:hypothetical protein
MRAVDSFLIGTQVKYAYIELPSLDMLSSLFTRDDYDEFRNFAMNRPLAELRHDLLDVGFYLVVGCYCRDSQGLCFQQGRERQWRGVWDTSIGEKKGYKKSRPQKRCCSPHKINACNKIVAHQAY